MSLQTGCSRMPIDSKTEGRSSFTKDMISPKHKSGPEPKEDVINPNFFLSGRLTQNGLFLNAVRRSN